MEKSIGELIDELSICNIKSFWFQETVMNNTNDLEVADASRKAQQVNSRRSKLIKEINKYFNDDRGPSDKTY